MASQFYKKKLLIEHLKDHPPITAHMNRSEQLILRQQEQTIVINFKAARVLADFIRDFIGE